MASPTDPTQNTPMHNLTVLVLDDEPTVRELLTRFLTAHGYHSAEAGIAVMRSTRIGAVVLDVRLPSDGSGLDVLQRLRERPKLQSIPAIILTGGGLTEDEQRLVAHHRAHVFYKPEGLDSLIGFLEQLTGHDQPH